MQAVKGQWVQVSNIVLDVGERAAQAPKDTQALPLEMWVKGHLVSDAQLDDQCTIVTPTGRHVAGKLVEIEPGYHHAFGEYVPELDAVRRQVLEMMSYVYSKGASGV
ncbi:MAG: 2-amino-4-oxopentanoate thiolase subunit OrtA [Defluviitaleaceae bacterium]|nr:2-amino-4-oxopentanoate thiolase subunit OrtA [Defluviitaleaceae bacterium]